MTEEKITEHNDACEKRKAELRQREIVGAWNAEPNRLNWKYAGLDCMVVRNQHTLVLCGYVGAKKNHKFYATDYNDQNLQDIDVHGGLTYSQSCRGYICHIDDGDDTHWFGFDCAHFGDLCPEFLLVEKQIGRQLSTFRDGVYRDINYVKQETEKLANQLCLI